MASDHSLGRTYPPKPAQVYLFSTCLVDQFAPQAGMDTVQLLEREGITVHFPEHQTCCGQPAYSSGFPDEARAVAARQLDLFPEPWPIVVPSGSCAGMMRHHYPKLFANDSALLAKAMDVSERIFELSEFLVHVVDFARPDLGTPCTVALHTSCHARREMGCHDTSLALLAVLGQVDVKQHARVEECCGFGGTFALTYPDISQAMVTEKVAAIVQTGADRVVSADCGCLFNMAGRAARQDEEAGRTTPSLSGEHIASFVWRRTAGAQS
jgi:L-lactate dehydrogenase complex protein LldE